MQDPGSILPSQDWIRLHSFHLELVDADTQNRSAPYAPDLELPRCFDLTEPVPIWMEDRPTNWRPPAVGVSPKYRSEISYPKITVITQEECGLGTSSTRTEVRSARRMRMSTSAHEHRLIGRVRFDS